MVPAIHQPSCPPPPPLDEAAWAPTLPWLPEPPPEPCPEVLRVPAVDGVAAPSGAPHPVQNREPGSALVPQSPQVRPPREAPQEAQKFPLACAPQWGQVVSVI
jgi:hypothetical protein